MPYMTSPQNPDGWRAGKPSGYTDATGPQMIEAFDRAVKAVEMRRDGATWDDVKLQCGYTRRADARRAVLHVLARNLKQAGSEEVRGQEAAVLDDLEDEATEVMLTLFDKARAAEREDSERAYYDGALRAMDRVLRVMDRRAKLLGLDAPEAVNFEAMLIAMALKQGRTLTRAQIDRGVEMMKSGYEDLQSGVPMITAKVDE